jgi:hypothetical protein
LFPATGTGQEAVDQMSDTALEQMSIDMVPHNHLEEESRYQALLEYSPTVEKLFKIKGNTMEKLWQEYIIKHPDSYRLSQFKRYYLIWLKVRKMVKHI